MKALYTATAMAHGGREGQVTSDGGFSHELRVPKEMGGPGGGSNPEQLFAAGYAACFESAVRLLAKKQEKPLKDASITARVTLNATEDHKYVISVELVGKLDGVPEGEALALLQGAHEICPYSSATRGNVQVKLSTR